MPNANPAMSPIAPILAKKFKLSDREAQQTVTELFFYLFSEDIVRMLTHNNDPLPVIVAIREQFATHFHASNETLRSIFTPEVNLKLAQFLTHFKYFNYPANLLVNPEKISYLNDNFQDYKTFSQEVIDLLPHYYPDRQFLLHGHREALIIDFLLLMLTNFDLSVLAPPIDITIDFTYGENYTKLIEKEIQDFHALNLTVSHQLTDKTDILISNLSPQVCPNIHKLQWTSPPTATDWAFLGNLIVQVKKRKSRSPS
jgi:hypothetical protein